MDEQGRLERAKKRVAEIKEFYQHLTVYLVVMAALAIINVVTSPGYLWFFWALLGWGIAVVLHGFSVFGGFWGAEWEERKTRELMAREERRDRA
jgi:hypothetical protein